MRDISGILYIREPVYSDEKTIKSYMVKLNIKFMDIQHLMNLMLNLYEQHKTQIDKKNLIFHVKINP